MGHLPEPEENVADEYLPLQGLPKPGRIAVILSHQIVRPHVGYVRARGIDYPDVFKGMVVFPLKDVEAFLQGILLGDPLQRFQLSHHPQGRTGLEEETLDGLLVLPADRQEADW